jgi:NTE family protein
MAESDNTKKSVPSEVKQGEAGLLQGPVHVLPGDTGRQLDDGPALCLSGGGFRAMLFHTGVLWRLNECGILPKLKRISSVSGGSIIAGQLAMKWDSMDFSSGTAPNFKEQIVDPIMNLANHSIDIWAGLKGIFSFGSISKYVAKSYSKFLFDDTSLHQITTKDPDNSPFFIFNSTSVQSGVLWRFTRDYMWDYRVGKIADRTVPLAIAIAASSAFPPFLSPLTLHFEPSDFVADSGTDMQEDRFRTRVVLTDGGVYDNIGLETVWKNFKQVLVSDAGGGFEIEDNPKRNWLSHTYRTLNTIDNQVRSLRKREVVDSYIGGVRTGSYWSIRSDMQDYQVPQMLNCPIANTTSLANISTRLGKLDSVRQKQLINWGYAITDSAIRKFVDTGMSPPKDFPFPDANV